MWNKFCSWLYSDPVIEAYEKCIADNNAFMATLDERQLAYYQSLESSLYKAITRLETRVYNLENKKD